MKNIAFFCSGGGTNMAAVLKKIGEGKICGRAAYVVSSSPSAYALVRAEEAGVASGVFPLKAYESAEDRDRAILAKLKENKIDLIVLAGYLGIVTGVLINAYRGRIINIHPALLPKYGGKGYFGINVHREVLSHKEAFTGATVHFVDEGTDTGAIIMQKSVPVEPCDTPESLQQKVMLNCEYIILPEAVRLFCEDKLRLEGGKAIFI